MSEEVEKKLRALLFQGPGFSEDGVLEAPLREQGYEVQIYNVLPSQQQTTELDLGADDTLFLRAPSAGNIDDVLYTKVLSHSLSSIGAQIQKLAPDKRPKVVATGRWALGVLLANFVGDLKKAGIEYGWKNMSVESAWTSWLRVKSKKNSEKYYALKSSNVLLDLQGAPLVPLLETDLHNVVGWSLAGSMFLFSVDPFALIDGSQLRDFGYENQEDLLNGAHYLNHLLGEV